MCNADALSLGAQGLGAGTQAIGAAYAASSQRNSLDLQAYFNDMNADAARQDAREVLRQSEFAQQEQMLKTAQLKSTQRAAMASNGVDLTTGSPLDILVSTDYMGEVDRNTVRANAAREAAGHRARGAGYSMQSTVDRAAASGINPLLSGATSLITSASGIARDWYYLNKVGAVGGGKTSNK